MSFTPSLKCGNCSGQQESCGCKSQKSRLSLFTAAQFGDFQQVKTILENNADGRVNLQDAHGYTVLHYAAQWNHFQIVQYLCDKYRHSIDVNCHEKCGATPLHRAAYKGSFESCRILILHHALVNVPDKSFLDFKTPLHKAAEQGHIDVVLLLLKANADPNLRDAKGQFPATIAKTIDIKNLLLRNMKFQFLDDDNKCENIVEKQNPVALSIHTTIIEKNSVADDILKVATNGIPCAICSKPEISLVRNKCCKSLVCMQCEREKRSCSCSRGGQC